MKNSAENEVIITDKQRVIELATKLKSLGYHVMIAGKGTYGFFYITPDKLISFQIDIWWFNFSSNHKSSNLGTGHRLTNDEKCILWEIDEWGTPEFFESLINCKPMMTRRKNEYFIKWTTLDEHQNFYQSSSKYTKF